MQEKVNALLRFLAKPLILFYIFPWLLCILVVGTISQRYIGLYESEKLFFSSWVIWVGPVPLPGMIPVLAVLGISLTAKLILKSPWTKKTSGTVITHMGALLLLFGGMLTAITAEEGSITFEPGEEMNLVSDYHQRELAVLRNDRVLLTIPREALSAGMAIVHPDLPFNVQVMGACRHCEAGPQRYVNEQHRGLAEKIAIKAAPLRVEDEENQFGATLSVEGAGDDQDGIYIAFEVAPHQPSITIGEDHYIIAARKSQRPLPFTVRLDSFQKFSYPGTDMAEEYESIVSIIDGEVEWQSPIRMNEPLRYKGYTLYQSSFIQAGGQEFSVLAVVRNAGRVFPYISSIVMCIGLLIHLFARRRRKVAL